MMQINSLKVKFPKQHSMRRPLRSAFRMSKGVKQELIERYNQIQAEKRFCYNCRSDSTRDTHNRMIFWKAYTFCSAWCQYDTESDIRKSWKQFTRHI